MKLNNQQIQSLAHNIYKELREENTKYNTQVREKAYKEFFKTKLGKMFLEINDLGLFNSGTLTPLDVYNNATMISTLDKYLKVELRKVYAYNSADVFNDIVVATIECENIDELINKVKNKYK